MCIIYNVYIHLNVSPKKNLTELQRIAVYLCECIGAIDIIKRIWFSMSPVSVFGFP